MKFLDRLVEMGPLAWTTAFFLLLGFTSLALSWPIWLIVVIHVIAYVLLGFWVLNLINQRNHSHRK